MKNFSAEWERLDAVSSVTAPHDYNHHHLKTLHCVVLAYLSTGNYMHLEWKRYPSCIMSIIPIRYIAAGCRIDRINCVYRDK